MAKKPRRVTITIRGKRITRFVHRLIAAAHLPKPKNDDADVIFLNGDNQDCRASNLKYVTHSEAIRRSRARKNKARAKSPAK